MVSIPSQKVLQTLTCSECGKYLSVGPVRFKEDGSNVCGRCLVHGEAVDYKLTPARSFELFLQELLFHCSYHIKGCNRMFEWNAAMDHEVVCRRRIYKCPILPEGSCSWQDTCDKLISHFSTDHKDLLLIEPKYDLQLDKDSQTNQLLFHMGQLFLIQTRVSVQENLLWSCVRFLGPQEMSGNYEYNYELTNSDSTNEENSIMSMLTKTRKALDDFSLLLDKSASICINVQRLLQLFECSNIISFAVNLTCLDNNRIATPVPPNSLVQCKWPQCFKVLFNDAIEVHEENCDKKATSCSWPGCSYAKSSGDIKEHASKCDRRTVQCRWPGCGQQILCKELENHQDQCLYRDRRSYKCKIGNCEWSGEQKDMLAHYQQQHPQRLYCERIPSPSQLQNTSKSNSVEFNIAVGHKLGFRWCLLAHGELFRCWYGFEEKSNVEVVRAIYVGPDCFAKKYEIAIELGIKVGAQHKTSCKGPDTPTLYKGDCNSYGGETINIILGDCKEYVKNDKISFVFKIVVKS